MKELIIIADYTQEETLNITELCVLSGLDLADIHTLIEHEIIHPLPSQQFDLDQLKRIKIAIRLQRDLEINLAGTALILELLDRIDDLEARNQLLERFFS